MTSLIQIHSNKNSAQTPFNFFHDKKTSNGDNCFLHLKQQYLDARKNIDFSDKKTYIHIGISTIIIAGIGLLFSKGVQKQISNVLGKIKNHLEYKLENNTLDKKDSMSENFMRGVASFIRKTESINNITSLKDILFMRLMYKTKSTKKLHQGITNYFDKLSVKTIEKSYKKTEKMFQTMENKFKNLDAYILKNAGDEKFFHKGKEYTIKELLDFAKGYREEIYETVKIFTAPEAQKRRNIFIQEANSKLYETFWDATFKDFTTKNNKFKRKEMWQTFIAADQMSADKTHLANTVAFLRGIISYNNEDKSDLILKHLQDLKKMIPRFDSEGYNQVKKLEWYVKDGEGLKNNKEVFLRELNKLLNQKEFKNVDKKIVDNLKAQKESFVKLILHKIDEKEAGQTHDLLSIYYQIAPFEFAKSGALQALKKTVKSFDKAINLEISEYFDKVRDLKLGSAPTDVLTILLSTGLVGYDLHKAKDDKQRTSVMLTSGIPLVGAVATTIYSASKLVSGGKSLALGILSGVFLNVIGKSFDKLKNKASLNKKNDIIK